MKLFRRRRQNKEKIELQPPWAVRALGRLLVLQGLGLIGLATLTAPTNPQPIFDELVLPGAFAILALLSLISAFSLLRLRMRAWDMAMLVEGACLLLGLFLHSRAEKPVYIYPLMIYAILMVLYLNHPEIRATFPDQSIQPEGEEPS